MEKKKPTGKGKAQEAYRCTETHSGKHRNSIKTQKQKQ